MASLRAPVSNVQHCKYEDLFWNNKNYGKKNSLSFDFESQGVLYGMSVHLKKNKLTLEVSEPLLYNDTKAFQFF